jgi:hypothetical protein
MTPGSRRPGPMTPPSELKWEWDALMSARTRTIEEDVLGELPGREDAKGVATEQPWLQVDIALAGKVHEGSSLILSASC